MTRRSLLRAVALCVGAAAVLGLTARSAGAAYFFRYRFHYSVHRCRRRVRQRHRRR